MCAYRRDLDKTKYMPFFIKSNELLVNLIVNLYTMKNI